MKVNSINFNIPKISFRGYAPTKDNYGYKAYEFNYPFDENEFDCYLELFNVEKDKNGNYSVTDAVPNFNSKNGELKLKNGKNTVNLASDYFILDDTPFAYHYKLVRKSGGHPSYAVDAGNIIDNTEKNACEIYNYVTQSGSNLTHGGAMKLIVPDNYRVGEVYNKELFTKDNIIKEHVVLNTVLEESIAAFYTVLTERNIVR